MAEPGSGGGTIKIFGKPVKKSTAYIAGAAGVVVIGYAIISKRKAAAAASSSTAGMVTDPAGNTCSAIDANSGYCPGTAGDQAYYTQQQASQAGLFGGGSSVNSGGTAYPVQPGSGIATPGSVVPTFTDNASWMQYVEAYLVANEGDNALTLGNALGKYLAGAQVTSDQQALIEQAIAAGNLPPVAGPGGFPPSIRLAAGTPPPGGGTPPPASLPAPAGLSVTPGTGFADFGWGVVTGAKSYELQVTGPTPYDHTGAGNHAEHVPLHKGAYHARARATGGSWTALKAFTVK